MAEWLKAHAWKACIRATVSWVRIPLPPPEAPRTLPPRDRGTSNEDTNDEGSNLYQCVGRPEDSPEQAATMTMRSNVMIAITKKVRGWNTTQARAARRLGITQPRLK